MQKEKSEQKIDVEIEPKELNLWKTTVANAKFRIKDLENSIQVEKVFLMAAMSKLKEVERSGK